MKRGLLLSLGLYITVLAVILAALTLRAFGQNRYGCGIAGGPGYRAQDGQCVGARNLERLCGDPPETACVFEGAGERPPPCKGCGCKGGPGWRKPNGNCAGHRELARACGNPPGAPCSFEGALKPP